MFYEIYSRLVKEKKTHKIKIIWINASKELLDSRNQKNLRKPSSINSPGINLEIEYPTDCDLIFSGQEEKHIYLELIQENSRSE